MQRWQLTLGLSAAAAGAALLAPTLIVTQRSSVPEPAPLEIIPTVPTVALQPPPQRELPLVVSFRDADGDGFGQQPHADSVVPDGYVRVDGDCDDSSPQRHPGALEIEGDGIDQDCDGIDPAVRRPTPPPARPPARPVAKDPPGLLIPELDTRPLQPHQPTHPPQPTHPLQPVHPIHTRPEPVSPQVPDGFWDDCPGCGMG